MRELNHQHVLVIGLGLSGQAAGRLLLRKGAKVTAVDSADTPALRRETGELSADGVTVQLGLALPPEGEFELAVVSPGVPLNSPFMQAVRARGIPVIGELELGYQFSLCLNLAITGTNGKTTTTELVERILTQCQRRTLAAGNIGWPLCSIVNETRELDFLALEVSSFQLETIQYFRPSIGVLLNITPDHLDRYDRMEDYARAKARLFMNQQPHDFAIVQSEALAQLRALNVKIPAKLITFSAGDSEADLYLERGLILSRLPNWSGVLLDLDQCRLRGPHNAENLMAALAVGRVLRLPLETLQTALKSYEPAPHRCEWVAEINGVQFVNDSKATNVDALRNALLAMPAGKEGAANVFLIAGGKDKGFEFHDLGPLLARRVKRAFLLGETREKLRAAWSLFTPCVTVDSLLEAVSQAGQIAVAGDVVLLSPACSSFDMFQNYQHRGDVFRQSIEDWRQTTRSGSAGRTTIGGGVGLEAKLNKMAE